MPQNYPYLTPAPPPGQVVPPNDDFNSLFEQRFPFDIQGTINQFKTEQRGSSETIKRALAQMKERSGKRPTLDKIMAALNSIAAIVDLTGKSGGARRSAPSKFAANREARQERETGRIAKLRQSFLDTFATEELLGKRRQTALDATLSGAKIKTAQVGVVAGSLAAKKRLKQGGEAQAAKDKLIATAMKIFKDYTPDEIANSPELQYILSLGGGRADYTSSQERFANIHESLSKEVENSGEYKALAYQLEGEQGAEVILAQFKDMKVKALMSQRYPSLIGDDAQVGQVSPFGSLEALPSIGSQLPEGAVLEDFLPAIEGRQQTISQQPGAKSESAKMRLDEAQRNYDKVKRSNNRAKTKAAENALLIAQINYFTAGIEPPAGPSFPATTPRDIFKLRGQPSLPE